MLVQLGMIAASLIASVSPPLSLHDAFNSQRAYAYTAKVWLRGTLARIARP